MKRLIIEKCFILLSFISLGGLPIVAGAGTEGLIEASIFNIGDSSSDVGNSKVANDGIILEIEYEIDAKIFTFGYERWNYSWTNPADLPFAPGIVGDPWDSFSTLVFGFAYETVINKRWETIYFVEMESAYEKETNGSYAYEVGVEFVYEPSKTWAYNFLIALEYEDLDGSDIGGEVGIEWNPDAKQGWSGEFLVSTDAPEITLNYRFDRELSTSAYFIEGGGSLVRLADASPVPGHQAGYVEDQYAVLGLKVDYTMAYKKTLSFSVQQNSSRTIVLTDKAGIAETEYDFGDSVEISVNYSHEF